MFHLFHCKPFQVLASATAVALLASSCAGDEGRPGGEIQVDGGGEIESAEEAAYQYRSSYSNRSSLYSSFACKGSFTMNDVRHNISLYVLETADFQHDTWCDASRNICEDFTVFPGRNRAVTADISGLPIGKSPVFTSVSAYQTTREAVWDGWNYDGTVYMSLRKNKAYYYQHMPKVNTFTAGDDLFLYLWNGQKKTWVSKWLELSCS